MSVDGQRRSYQHIHELAHTYANGRWIANKTFAVNHPRLFGQLVRLDDALAPRWPFNGWGDFFILTMEFIG